MLLREFVEMTELAPLRHDQVAIFIHASSVGRVADAVLPLVGRQAEVGALFFVGVVAHLGGDATIFIEDGDTTLKFGKDGVFAAELDSRGHTEILLNYSDEVAIEVPMFNAVVVAVANEQQRFRSTGIETNSMAGFKLSFRLARAAKRFDELPIFVELQHVVRTVAIGDED